MVICYNFFPVQPCYSWFEVPYYWAGLKAYDLVANLGNLGMSSYLSAGESLRRFPTLAAKRSDGQTLKGTVRSSFYEENTTILRSPLVMPVENLLMPYSVTYLSPPVHFRISHVDHNNNVLGYSPLICWCEYADRILRWTIR
jgi:hypothetical protein